MMTRGARAERQAHLRLLDSLRLETEGKRKELENKYAAVPVIAPAQAEEILMHIRVMSSEAVIDYFQGYSLRMAGKNAFHYVYGVPADTRHDGDPEIAAAVESVNLALHAYDQARLDLRVAELFNGRLSLGKAGASSQTSARRSSALFELDMFEILISVTKAVSFYESLRGGDLRTLERENFEQLWPPFICARAAKKRK